MLKHIASAALLTLSCATASANDALERIEVISEDMTAALFDAMVEELGAQGADTDALKRIIPSTEWDAPMREAGQCVVDEFTARIGEDGLNAMLDKMEARLPEIKGAGMEALENMQSLLPEGMSEADASAINDQCGMTQLMQQKMMNPEFMSAVMSLMSQN